MIQQYKGLAFNVFLRVFQLGLQLILGYWATRSRGIQGCEHTFPLILSIAAYLLTFINLIALLYVNRSKEFRSNFFWVIFIVDLLIMIGIIAVVKTRFDINCAANKTLYQYYFFQVLQGLFLVIFITGLMCCNCFFQQIKYSNSPGNLAWGAICFLDKWGSFFQTTMIIIGIGMISISVSTFLFLLFLMVCAKSCSKVRYCCSLKRQEIVFCIFSIVCLLGLEVMAIIGYNKIDEVISYVDIQAKKTLQIFIVVNILDILFWIYGCYYAFSLDNGDVVRNQIFQENDTEQKKQSIF